MYSELIYLHRCKDNSGNKILFSTNGDGTIGYPYVKNRQTKPPVQSLHYIQKVSQNGLEIYNYKKKF